MKKIFTMILLIGALNVKAQDLIIIKKHQSEKAYSVTNDGFVNIIKNKDKKTIDQIIEKYLIEGYDIIQILKEGPVDVI